MNCYNSALFLREAIESVLAQDFQDWEIIFWDNRSTDQSAEITRSYHDPRIRYFLAPEHTPLGAARAAAFEHVRGEWVALLDCDDVWFPQKLRVQMSLADREPRLGLVYSDMVICNEQGHQIELGSQRYRLHRGHVWRHLLTERNFIPCPAAVMRRSVVQSVGGFPQDLRYCEEFELFLKIAIGHSVDYVPDPLVKYRIHGSNTTGMGSVPTTRELLMVLRRNLTRYERPSIRLRLSYLRRCLLLRLKLLSQIVAHSLKAGVPRSEEQRA